MTAAADLDVTELDISADDLLDAASQGDSGLDDADDAPATPAPKRRSSSRGKRRSSSTRKRSTASSSGARPLSGAAAQAALGKQVAAMHETIAVSVIMLSMALPPDKRPTDQEIDSIFMPLEQIYLMHADAWTPKPEYPLALAAGLALVQYLQRVGAFNALLRSGFTPRAPRRPATPAQPTPFRPRAAAAPPAAEQPAPPSPASDAANVETVLAQFHADNYGPLEDV